MKASSRFLVNNPSLPIQKEGGILPINILSTINNKTNVMSLVVSSVDALYYYLLPKYLTRVTSKSVIVSEIK